VNFFLAFCLTTLISIALSYASWKKIEKPAIDLAKKYKEFANE
jgi:peptidoglycan/LPS O-acetylase OafA/YrhL